MAWTYEHTASSAIGRRYIVKSRRLTEMGEGDVHRTSGLVGDPDITGRIGLAAHESGLSKILLRRPIEEHRSQFLRRRQ